MAILIRGGKANWKLLTLKFQSHGKWIENQGNPTLSEFEISLKTFVKTVKEIGIGYWIELRSTKEQVESYKQEIDKEINELLQEFPKLFEIPNTVPLQRPSDHAIRFVEGTKAQNIWPYCCPCYRKNKVEKIV